MFDNLHISNFGDPQGDVDFIPSMIMKMTNENDDERVVLCIKEFKMFSLCYYFR